MSDLIFYTNPQSRGRIVHWMLEELGEPYDTQWINYGEEMKSAAYRAVNPMGKVPAIRHNGAVITETPAICTYLALQFPAKKLIPAQGDPRLADFTRWMFFAAAPLEMATTARSLGWEVAKEREGMVGFGNYLEAINALDIALSKGPYICGEHFTAVDVYLGSALMWGMQFGTIDKRDLFSDYVERVTNRPAALAANRLNEEYLATQKKD